jgi:nucleoside 2-deoxyribosyltransferase
MRIYFSSPQNTPYQRAFVEDCVEILDKSGFEVILAVDPYINDQSAFEQTREKDGKPLISDETNSGKLKKNSFAHQVFKDAYKKLAEADVLIALLDGSQVDDRVACEIGIFYGLMRTDPSKKGILGLATDTRCLRRRDSTYGINIFTLGTLEEVGKVEEELNSIIEILNRWNKKE